MPTAIRNTTQQYLHLLPLDASRGILADQTGPPGLRGPHRSVTCAMSGSIQKVVPF